MEDIYIAKTEIGFGAELDGEDMSFNLFFSGCDRNPKCPECHNPALWKRDENCKTTLEEICEMAKKNSDLTNWVVFLGGEPMDQPEAALELCYELQDLGFNVCLYTGHFISDMTLEQQEAFDMIVAGPFDPTKATGSFPPSTNQIVLRN